MNMKATRVFNSSTTDKQIRIEIEFIEFVSNILCLFRKKTLSPQTVKIMNRRIGVEEGAEE